MKKRDLKLGAVLALVLFALGGCGGSSSSTSATTTTTMAGATTTTAAATTTTTAAITMAIWPVWGREAQHRVVGSY